MSPIRKSVVILYAEDDEDDREMTLQAFQKNQLANPIRCVSDGEELTDYLFRRGSFANPDSSPRPGIILLDLNMPRKSGREALREIKSDPDLRRIPVVVLTTSRADEDIVRSYDLGVSGFITKPVTFSGLVEAVATIGKYWMDIVELPTR